MLLVLFVAPPVLFSPAAWSNHILLVESGRLVVVKVLGLKMREKKREKREHMERVDFLSHIYSYLHS